MLKLTEKFTDYNGVEREMDFHFNLNKAEIMEMELSVNGGLAEQIEKIVAAKDSPAIIKIFKELVLKSYGEKSADGLHFVKSEEITKRFEQTEAYSNIFMRLATDADAAAKFVNGIIPSDMANELAKSDSTHPALK